MISPFAIVAFLLPPLQQLNTFSKLIGCRLIDAAPGAGNQFRIQPPMIDSAVSGDRADKQPVEIP